METLYSFVTLWSSKRLRSTTESPEVLEPTRLIPSPEQRLPLPSSSLEEANAALVVGSTGPGGSSGLAGPPLLQQPPPFTITPVVEVADTAPTAASVTVTAATLETGPTERVGTPLAKHPAVQQQQQGPATTIVEGGGGDAAAAAALMSLKLGKR